ncbi:hypothetical protein, partial [Acinetobacter baumannii]|uniref:hypothetical protein n=1 Tax=Acinetobacter baumannii TaxID=470 RepID=UPI00197AAF8E
SIINIRVVEQTNFDGEVYKEMVNSAIDAQCLVSTCRHHSCCCYITTLLAFPNIQRAEITSQMEFYYTEASKPLLNVFYLSKEDLQDTQHLQKWWNQIFET